MHPFVVHVGCSRELVRPVIDCHAAADILLTPPPKKIDRRAAAAASQNHPARRRRNTDVGAGLYSEVLSKSVRSMVH